LGKQGFRDLIFRIFPLTLSISLGREGRSEGNFVELIFKTLTFSGSFYLETGD